MPGSVDSDDADKYERKTNWDALMEGIDNRNRDPSDGLEEYLGASVPSGFDDAWEEGLDDDNAESKYESKTTSDAWTTGMEGDWNVG